MPTHLRSLIVIMLLSTVVLWLGRRYATQQAMLPEDYKRRAFSWVALTLVMFLSHSYALFLVLTLPLILIVGGRDSNRLAYFAFLMFVVPMFPWPIDMGGTTLVRFDHLRWLSIFVLIPAWWSLRSQSGVVPFGRHLTDKFIIGYIVLWLVLQSTSTTMTNLVRIGIYMVLDIVLPYYVASRGARDMRAFKDVVMAFVMAVLLLAPVAVFEFGKSWLVYNSINEIMGLPFWGYNNYLPRGEAVLRSSVTTGHPIVLGYLMCVALGLNAFLRTSTKPALWRLAVFGLSAGLIAGMSRGPWVGTAVVCLVFLVTGPHISSKLVRVGALSLVLLPVLLMTEQGQKMLDYLPFIGTVESKNVDFRARLIEVSLGVLAKFPFFGALDYLNDPDMEQMRGGDGIIDIVNAYLGVAMASGVVGLTLFVGPFVIVCIGIVRKLYFGGLSPDSDEHLLGRAILATLLGIMVTIGTVAAITVVPFVYLTVIGLGTAYLQYVATSPATARAPQAARAAPPERHAPHPWGPAGRHTSVRRPRSAAGGTTFERKQ